MAAKQRFPWVGVSAVAAFVVVMLAAWLQIPTGTVDHIAGGGLPSLELKRMGSESGADLITEKLEAYDPRPLFVPSWMNSNGAAQANEALGVSGGPFAEIPPKLMKDGPLRFPVNVPTGSDVVSALGLTERPTATLALGRADTIGNPVAKRLAGLEAINEEGRVVLSLDIPDSGSFPQGDWQPMELLGAVSRSGLVGELALIVGSGSEQIDEYFRSHLRENVRIGARLSEGFYTFRVGP